MGDAPNPLLLTDLAFYASPPHSCSYLPEEEATTLFADPHAEMSMALYGQLIDLGFRRSGRYVYQPRCRRCTACLPARLPVTQLRPTRSQRRTWARNQDLTVSVRPAAFSEEHYALYRRYMATRHPGGGMDVDQPDAYMEFLCSDWSDTRFVEFREGATLVAVAVTDYLRQGLSAVYTFFSPEAGRRGLGTYAILWQADAAARSGRRHLYLGYWIEGSQKMAYKGCFRPLEVYRQGVWHTVP